MQTDTKKNNLTLLTDGGYLLMRTMFFFENGFRVDAPEAQKRATAEEFKKTLAQTITKIVNQIPEIDNVILMSEGGSWRKNLPIPKQLADTTYKGHRERKVEIDWAAIYKAYNEFVRSCEKAGMTCSQHSAIEGDDWAWYWSRRLNAEKTNVMVWSSDCDLKQLVQFKDGAFTCWYNDKVGLVLPDSMAWLDDPIEAMMNPPLRNAVSESLTKRLKKVIYINPDLIVINKVLCGDAGDNIKSVIRYKKETKNGTRTYRFSDKDYEKFITETGIQRLDEFKSDPAAIASYITENKKFKDYGFKKEDILEMLDYNLRLVWLNEEVIPETITTAMVQFEYKVLEIADLRHNYKLLLEPNKEIENIFNSIAS